MSDGVIHCAFNHDFSNFLANCEQDRKIIEAIGLSPTAVAVDSANNRVYSRTAVPRTSVAVACNHPNLLVLPFSVELIRLEA